MAQPWESKSVPKESRPLMTYLIQINTGISAFHLDDESVGGVICLHQNFVRTVKIVVVALSNSSACRETIREMVSGLYDTRRPVGPGEHVKVWLTMVRSQLCSMHILSSGETGKFLQNGLFHGVITLFKKNLLGTSLKEDINISFLYGKYEKVGACPSSRMDPDNGEVNGKMNSGLPLMKPR